MTKTRRERGLHDIVAIADGARRREIVVNDEVATLARARLNA